MRVIKLIVTSRSAPARELGARLPEARARGLARFRREVSVADAYDPRHAARAARNHGDAVLPRQPLDDRLVVLARQLGHDIDGAVGRADAAAERL